jgi:hypothetical protein
MVRIVPLIHPHRLFALAVGHLFAPAIRDWIWGVS